MTDTYNDTELDTGVSEDAFEQDPVLAEYQTEEEQSRWLVEIEAARKERKVFRKTGIETIKRYADERDETEKGQSHYNVFFMNTDIKMSALYARTPVPDIKRRFNDADDDVSRVAANLLQRNISYELECGGFDSKFKQILFDRCVPGVGVGWARLEQEEQEGPITFDAATGHEVPSAPVITNQFAEIDHVAWDDFLWAPCQVWSLCRWVGRRIPMSQPAIKQRFERTAPALVLANLSYEKAPEQRTDGSTALKPKNSTEATVDVYELWDKERRLVFWITEAAEVPLDVQADTNDFPEFFPTPLPPLGRFTTSNTTPISDYSLTQDLYNELDNLNHRCSRLVQALKLKWVYDASVKELRDLYTTTDELEGIGVDNWAAFTGDKGGLKNSIEFAPLAEAATTYQQLITARDLVKSQIYEIEGISDFMRGAATQYESLGAATQRASLGSTRLSVLQQEVADYAARLLRLKAHLICKFYQPEFIVKRAGMLAQADAQLIGPAIQLLRDEQLQHFHLQVSTESIQLPNWNQEKQERTELLNAVTAYMSQMLPAAERSPGIAPLALSLLKFAVAGFKGAKDVEGVIDQGLEQLMQQQAAAKAQPPAPNAAELKAQAQQQRIQADMQIAQLESNTQLQMAQVQAQAKTQIAQLQAQMDAYDLRIKEAETALKQRELAVETQLRLLDARMDAMKTAHENANSMVTLVPTGGR